MLKRSVTPKKKTPKKSAGAVVSHSEKMQAYGLEQLAAGSGAWWTVTNVVPALRAAYLREIEQLAETLRRGLEAGALGEDYSESIGKPDPRGDLDAICAKRFHMEVSVRDVAGGTETSGNEEGACLILALSPSSGVTLQDTGWEHVCHAATDAVALDVLDLAKVRGWLKRRAA